ncbi:MAG: ABC transporter substrate-binding protein [Streptosporangiales bacterium]|nr:ABC transporter substrate-binding protein [Streptosporangiales bacterium]
MLAVAACGTTEAPKEQSTGADIKVTDSRGEQTLPGPAKRVVALEWGLVENLLTLGVTPVGIADIKQYNVWVSAEPAPTSVKDVGLREEVSLDAVAGLDPDLILATTSGACGKPLPQFEKIADVLCFDGTDPNGNLQHMRDQFTAVAKSVGKGAEGDKVLADFDAKLADGKQKIADAGLAGTKLAGAHGWTDQGAPVVRMFGKRSLGSDVAEEMGLENAWTGKSDDWGLAMTDVEGLTKIGDAQFYYIAPVDNIFETKLPKNRIWQNLSFVKKDQVHKLDGGTWLFGGPASTSQFVDELVAALT